MKTKLVFTGLAIAGLAVSSAVAAPPADKGKPKSGPGCKPAVAVILKGTLDGTPGASATSIKVQVTSGNRWARDYVKATQPTSIAVNPQTKVRRQGGKTLGVLLDKDRVLVQARVCKADLTTEGQTLPALTASKVIAHGAKAEKQDKEEKSNNGKGKGKDKDEDD